MLQQTFARWQHALNNYLIVAARLVQCNVGAYQYLLTVLWSERYPAIAVAKHRAAYLSGVIFEREIPVTGGRLSEIRNFTADPHLSHFLLKQQTNRLIQAAYGKN
ncbi:Uncharacterised protein [Citrobacter braakii]|nr:Uncharacterised protein [Citrobacter braakii]